MDWWDELWLKEGFATFAGYQAIDHIFPDWKYWSFFLQKELHLAFTLDANVSSHPIQVPCSKPSEIGEIFDDISYNKGASIIRMLEGFLSKETFAAGVSNYLKKHSFKNATTLDLWLSLLGESLC